jgi:hypothetical protein
MRINEIIRESILDNPSFKKWFGNSISKDSSGNPIIFYHGTTESFDEFLSEKGGSSTLAEDTDQAFFFTSSVEVADDFAGYMYTTKDKKTVDKTYFRGANIMPVYLKMENPQIWDKFGGAYEESWLQAAIKEAKEEGCDSIIFRNMKDGSINTVGPWKTSHVVAVFSPTQIKSAIGNKGTFSPNSSNITENKNTRLLSNQYSHILKDADAIAEYISSISSSYVNEEFISEYFRGCQAVLKNIPINSVHEGNADSNVRSEAKEKRYIKKSSQTIPPLVVWDGEIVDGNHRYRVAKQLGLTSLWCYVVIVGEV